MKKKVLIGKLAVLFIALLSIVSCNQDDDPKWNATTDPVISLVSEVVHSGQGRTFVIAGKITDDLGIESIHLKIDEWFLDKTIQVYKGDSLTTNYDLNYKFEIPESAEDKEFNISVTVTNVGDRSVAQNLIVLMDGDFDYPTLLVKNPAEGLTIEPSAETILNLTCDLSDARQLGYFVVSEPSLNLYDSISFMGEGLLEYSYSKAVTIPAKVAEYSFNFMVADSAGLVVSAVRNVSASFVYQKMYLADVATDAELVSDLFGVPMLISTTGENLFEAKYYAASANTEVRFIPQNSSFTPHCFGLDPNNSDVLIDSESALPIVLPQVGYYKITIDVNALTYLVEQYTPTSDIYESNTSTSDDNLYVGELGLVGKGFPEYADQNWSPGTAIAFDRDPVNPYRFIKTLDLEGTVEFIFAPQHQSGWWIEPFWRFDNKEQPEVAVPNGGDNVALVISERATYQIVFDSHLNRTKAVKVN